MLDPRVNQIVVGILFVGPVVSQSDLQPQILYHLPFIRNLADKAVEVLFAHLPVISEVTLCVEVIPELDGQSIISQEGRLRILCVKESGSHQHQNQCCHESLCRHMSSFLSLQQICIFIIFDKNLL